MSMGEAKTLHRKTDQPVMIVGRDGRPIKSDLFAGVPYLTQRPTRVPFQRLLNGPGARSYIAGKTVEQWTWHPYRPEPAEVVFTAAELDFAKPYAGMVMVEPHVKNIGHQNKAWLDIYWQQLDSEIHTKRIASLVQCGPAGTRPLLHTTLVTTPTFRLAMAVLSVCKALVATEGGLAHAAAAVGVPAVVVFGAFISPEVTGYKQHRNLFNGTSLGCGLRTHCEHCRTRMAEITPTQVLTQLNEVLR